MSKSGQFSALNAGVFLDQAELVALFVLVQSHKCFALLSVEALLVSLHDLLDLVFGVVEHDCRMLCFRVLLI